MNPWRYFVLDPIESASPALFSLRCLQVLHERTNGRSDRVIRSMMSTLRPRARLPQSQFLTDRDVAASVKHLRQRGWDILSWRLEATDINAIREFAFSTPAYATDQVKDRIEIRHDRIPRNHGRYQWRITDLIRVPAVQRIALDAGLSSIAQEYLGCRPILTSVTLWLDPVYDGHFGAHIYHYDNDGPSFLKFFIYLSDVDSDTGAHTYIQGSHSHTKPDRFRLSTFYDRDDLLSHYGMNSEIVFAAPAGTILAEDTAGFHRGMDLNRGYRLLMQLQYAIFDIPHEEEFRGGIIRAQIPELATPIRPIVRKFFA